MHKFSLLLASILFTLSTLSAQIDIADAINMNIGDIVTVEGVATNGAELGIIRYIQDETAAIAVYPGTGSVSDFSGDVLRGTTVQVTGALKEYNGLLEIDPINAYTVISSGDPLPAPLIITPDGISEDNEGMLVQILNVCFDNPGSVFTVGTHSFTVDGVTSQTYVRSGSPLENTIIPTAKVNITGIVSQFNAHQLLIRDLADVEIADSFYLTSIPTQSDITNNSFTISWATNESGSTLLSYGLTPDLGTDISATGPNTASHSITVDGLDPAEFYYVQASSVSEDGTVTATSALQIFSTASNSSGEINVYFTQDVDGSFSQGNWPIGTSGAALEAAIINKINSATTSIDACIYNINRETIVAALTNAHNNGVTVRYIADDETANLALSNPAPPFTFIDGNNGSALMHNKFFVIDAESTNDSWVIMGATNMTDGNITTDFNNMVFIQDKAIAKNYTWEFNEMWGSNEAEPGWLNVKFGEDKTNNTPHLFNLNGMMVESYFSPSDNTAANIINTLNTADNDLEFAMLTFTHNSMGNAVIDLHNAGVDVRGIIDNINDQGGEFDYLVSNGVNVIDDNTTLQTHHKYCIVDGAAPDSDPRVVTGSHNWSGGADSRNDENTLIFHDAGIANIFIMEFEARWCEFTGGVNCTTSNKEVEKIAGFDVAVFPNLATDYTNLNMKLDRKQDVTVSVWDTNGKMIMSRILRNVVGESNETLELHGFAAGNYLVSFKIGEEMVVKKLIVK